jgi:LPXTG-site transpeptidase (sortase) family protein
MKRQVLSTALCLSLLTVAVPPSFADIADPNAYADAVASLSSSGIIDGGGNVRLKDPLNRAEALKIILLAQNKYALDVERTKSAMPPLSLFPDVDQSAWYAPYIEVGFRHGLIKGYPDGKFWPQGGVKVAEAVAMITRSYGEQTDAAAFVNSDDLPNQQGQWYTGAVNVILARKAVMPGSRLSAGNFMTRGQLFDMVYRMRELHSQGLASFNGGSTGVQNAPVYSVNSQNTPSTALTPAPSSSSQFASKKPFAISVPSIGIVDLTVTHPSDPYSQKGVLAPLQDGVGHLFAYPGKGSKVMIYGHSSGYPWDLSKYTKIFRTINEVKVGSRIYVTYDGKLFVYQVSEKKTIPASDKTAFEPDEKGEQLVLYTCWPPDSISQRYLVYAVPVETIALK